MSALQLPAGAPLRRPIKVLPADLANRIAAGEVVERPASVVKELVENSIDAGGKRIEVEVRDGGKEYIRVSDDGYGMRPEELSLAFLRHATSKISTADELAVVRTLGFRGEALPSIAVCSEVEATTRPPDAAAGARLVVKGGVAEPVVAAAAPPGTTVIVRRLFYNTPARYKFLKQSATEKRYIADYMMQMALAHPEVAFRLLTEVGLLLATPGGGDLLAACSAIHGSQIARRMLPVAWDSPFAAISGFISPPDETRHNRGHESIFINGRWVQNRMLYTAVEKGYDTALPARCYPVVVLHVTMDPTMLDVNVHPAKTEVRFRQEGEMFRQLMLAVKAALSSAGQPLTSGLGRKNPLGGEKSGGAAGYILSPGRLPLERAQEHLQVAEPAPALPYQPVSPGAERPAAGAMAATYVSAVGGAEHLPVALAATTEDPALAAHLRAPLAGADPSDPDAPALREFLPDIPVLGQVLRTYIVLAAPDGLWLADQHVAHERILYEKALSSGGDTPAQLLLTPQPVQLTPPEAAAVTEALPDLAKAGVLLEPFGPASFLLRALPLDLSHAPGAVVLRELLADLVATWGTGHARLRERLAATIACKGAVKAGQPLSLPAQRTLIATLATTANPFHCPHGRPILIAIDRDELERRFQRR